MREILFRGKRVDNGEWVEGSLEIFKNHYRDKLKDFKKYWISYEVDPKTIGQYTGLKDKNGVKIFEGDQLKGNKTVVRYGIPKVENEFGTVNFASGMFKLGTLSLCTFADEFEVVGNIHD